MLRLKERKFLKLKQTSPIELSVLPDTVIVKESVAVLPLGSVAVKVTVVVPIGKFDPLEESDVSVTTPELSEAVGSVQVTAAVATLASVVVVTADGVPVIVGFSSSVINKKKYS